jgi:hypothetical protein
MSLLGLIAAPRMLLLFSRLLRLTARTGRGLARQQVVWWATRPAHQPLRRVPTLPDDTAAAAEQRQPHDG